MRTARERKKRRHSRYCLIPAIGPVVLAFFISPAVPIAGQTEEWHRYKNDRGNFSVLFPIEPKAFDTETTLVASGSTTYVVIYQDENFKHVEAVFQTYRDSALNEMAAKTNCELLKKGDPPSLRVRGYFGSLFRGKCAGKRI
jgi:hypothetical protein